MKKFIAGMLTGGALVALGVAMGFFATVIGGWEADERHRKSKID